MSALSGCGGGPPAGWQAGGALIVVPRARWILGDSAIELLADGRVLLAGEHVMTIDRAGRVVNDENEPVALLLPNGKVFGPGERELGRVGPGGAALAGDDSAWVTIAPTGEVLRHDDDGESRPFGAWVGCGASPWAMQTCTLVTHLLGEQVLARMRASTSSFGFGVGAGVGVPIR